MRLAFIGLGTLILTTLASPSLAAQRGSADPDRAAVRDIILAMAQHVQTGNFTAVDSLFAPRGHILTDTTTLHAWSEYRDGQLRAEIARFTAGFKLEHTAVEPQVRGTVAWVAFRQLLSGVTTNGTVQLAGRGTAVLEKRNDRWLIVHLHVSR